MDGRLQAEAVEGVFEFTHLLTDYNGASNVGSSQKGGSVDHVKVLLNDAGGFGPF